MRAELEDLFPDRAVHLFADAPAQATNAVWFVVTRHTGHVLAGHLEWRDVGGHDGQGPVMDLSVLDAPLNDTLLRAFGRQLVRFSQLPL
jgi:hypothetical protein